MLRKKIFVTVMSIFFAIVCLLPTITFAQTPDKINPADTAWVLISAALVMLMTPGLALFYGGMVRTKNVLATMMQSFILIALISVQWVLFGYSLAFGPDIGHFIGGLNWIGLKGVGLDPNPDYAATIPHQTFMIFQLMFAIITPALIAGAYAERKKFSSFLVFSLLWATLVYDPITHWIWGAGGWLRNLGALDFAGGAVVHISSGIAALAAALVMGKRQGFGTEPMPPHNLTMTLLGAGLLWFGWFGFNAGSALAANRLATSAFVATNTAGATAALTWMVFDWMKRDKPTVLGAATGAIAGLAAITPAAGFVSPISAILIGIGASLLCNMVIIWRSKKGIDDSLDAFGVHGVSGIWGMLATGLLAEKAINSAGANGFLISSSGLHTLWIQIVTITATIVYSFTISWVLLKLVDKFMGLRVSEENEADGLDYTQHGESGYTMEVP